MPTPAPSFTAGPTGGRHVGPTAGSGTRFEVGACGWRLARAIEESARAVGALDQALVGHPLATAWTLHQRIAAVVRESRVDGHLVDGHRLAALIAGLRPSDIGRGLAPVHRAPQVLALGHALELHAWHSADPAPLGEDADEGAGAAVAAALTILDSDPGAPALLAAGIGLWRALEGGTGRGPARAAIPHLLHRRGLTRQPRAGLTGAAALGVIHAGDRGQDWLAAFVDAVGREALDGLELLGRLERAWAAARAALAARTAQPGRRAVRSGAAIGHAVDLIAAQPLIGPARLAALLGLSVRQAGAVCEELTRLAAVSELTGRRTHRLYGLETLAPVRLNSAGPRPSGRRRLDEVLPAPHEADDRGPLPPPTPTPEYAVRVQPAEWKALMLDTDRAVARARSLLDRLRAPTNASDGQIPAIVNQPALCQPTLEK